MKKSTKQKGTLDFRHGYWSIPRLIAKTSMLCIFLYTANLNLIYDFTNDTCRNLDRIVFGEYGIIGIITLITLYIIIESEIQLPWQRT